MAIKFVDHESVLALEEGPPRKSAIQGEESLTLSGDNSEQILEEENQHSFGTTSTWWVLGGVLLGALVLGSVGLTVGLSSHAHGHGKISSGDDDVKPDLGSAKTGFGGTLSKKCTFVIDPKCPPELTLTDGTLTASLNNKGSCTLSLKSDATDDPVEFDCDRSFFSSKWKMGSTSTTCSKTPMQLFPNSNLDVEVTCSKQGLFGGFKPAVATVTCGCDITTCKDGKPPGDDCKCTCEAPWAPAQDGNDCACNLPFVQNGNVCACKAGRVGDNCDVTPRKHCQAELKVATDKDHDACVAKGTHDACKHCVQAAFDNLANTAVSKCTPTMTSVVANIDGCPSKTDVEKCTDKVQKTAKTNKCINDNKGNLNHNCWSCATKVFNTESLCNHLDIKTSVVTGICGAQVTECQKQMLHDVDATASGEGCLPASTIHRATCKACVKGVFTDAFSGVDVCVNGVKSLVQTNVTNIVCSGDLKQTCQKAANFSPEKTKGCADQTTGTTIKDCVNCVQLQFKAAYKLGDSSDFAVCANYDKDTLIWANQHTMDTCNTHVSCLDQAKKMCKAAKSRAAQSPCIGQLGTTTSLATCVAQFLSKKPSTPSYPPADPTSYPKGSCSAHNQIKANDLEKLDECHITTQDECTTARRQQENECTALLPTAKCTTCMQNKIPLLTKKGAPCENFPTTVPTMAKEQALCSR